MKKIKEEELPEEKIEENSVNIDTNESNTETPIESNPAE